MEESDEIVRDPSCDNALLSAVAANQDHRRSIARRMVNVKLMVHPSVASRSHSTQRAKKQAVAKLSDRLFEIHREEVWPWSGMRDTPIRRVREDHGGRITR